MKNNPFNPLAMIVLLALVFVIFIYLCSVTYPIPALLIDAGLLGACRIALYGDI